MGIDELRALRLFDGLTDDQLAELIDGSSEVRVEPGVDLFREGEHADYWWVLVDGALDLLRRIGREDTVVGKMPGGTVLRVRIPAKPTEPRRSGMQRRGVARLVDGQL